MIICPSIAPSTEAETRRALGACRRDELAELRIDAITRPHLETILAFPRPRLIVTNRRQTEGGRFEGSFREQQTILSNALAAGAEFIDVEYSWGHQRLSEFLKKVERKQVVLSTHHFTATPDRLPAIYAAMRKLRPGIIKIAVTANDISDNARIFSLLEQARKDHQPMIALCMGEHGEISRILGGMFGAWLSFVVPDGSKATAPGQFTREMMERLFRAGTINKQTRIFGLIGNPVSHSRGIYFHNSRFSNTKRNAVYLNFLVVEPGSFMQSIGRMITGASVTMPFKEPIIPFLGKITTEAAEISSVNTIIRKGGTFSGSNTDLPALRSLLTRNGSIRKKRVVVVGTGAMARTAVVAALRSGASVSVTGRSETAAGRLAERYGVSHLPFTEKGTTGADIVINTTAVGMHGTNRERLFPQTFFRKIMLVVDAVYADRETALIRSAIKAGSAVVTGGEIFEAQAALQSKLFLKSI